MRRFFYTAIFVAFGATISAPVVALDSDRIEKHINSVASQLDGSSTDISSFLNDAQTLTVPELRSALRVRITPRAYSGVLLGSVGALVSGQANSWDAALLAREALIAMNLETRLVRGVLSKNDANRLTEGIQPQVWPQISKKPELLLNAYSDLSLAIKGQGADALPFDGELISIEPADTVLEVYDGLSVALGDSAIRDADLFNDLVANAVDYVWVQYRSGPDDGWVDFHTLVEPELPIEGLTEVGDDDLRSAQYKVTLAIRVESDDATYLLAPQEFTASERRNRPIYIDVITRSNLASDSKHIGTALVTFLDGSSDLSEHVIASDGTLHKVAELTLTSSESGAAAGSLFGLSSGLGSLNSTIGGDSGGLLSKPEANAGAIKIIAEISVRRPFSKLSESFQRTLVVFDEPEDFEGFSGNWVLDVISIPRTPAEQFSQGLAELRAIVMGQPFDSRVRLDGMLPELLVLLPGHLVGSNASVVPHKPTLVLSGFQHHSRQPTQYSVDAIQVGLLGIERNGKNWRPSARVSALAGINLSFAESMFVEALSEILTAEAKLVSAWSDSTGFAVSDEGKAKRGEHVLLAGDEAANAWWRYDPETGSFKAVHQGLRGGAGLTLMPKQKPIEASQFGRYLRNANVIAELETRAGWTLEVSEYVLSLGLIVKDGLVCLGESIENLDSDQLKEDAAFVAWETGTIGGSIAITNAFGKRMAKKFAEDVVRRKAREKIAGALLGLFIGRAMLFLDLFEKDIDCS